MANITNWEELRSEGWCDFAGDWAVLRRPAPEGPWFCEFCGDDHSSE